MAEKPTYEALEQKINVLEKEKKENKRLEKEFIKRQKYLESVFHHAPDAIVTLDSSHHVLEWNPSAQMIFGYTSDEARGKDLDDLVSRPDVKNVARDNTHRVLSGQPLKPIESVRYKKDGTPVQVIASGAPIIIDHILKGVVAMYTDVTDRKEAETALRESEQKYRTVLEANPDPVVVYDINGKVVYFNPAFTDLFGWSLEERLGKKNNDFVPEEAWRETQMMIDKVNAGERFSGIETIRYNKKRKIIPVSISGAIYTDQNDHPIGSIINLRDISDKKKMEAQLQQSQKMEAIGTLAGGIAHDFNNILSGIFGYAQLTELQMDEPIKAKKNIQQIISSAQRAAALVRQILAFSRQSEYQKKPLAVFRLVKEALELIRSTIPANIAIKESLISKEKILGDSTRIHQVIMNLCTNAYHAMSESGGVLTVGLQEIQISEKKRGPDLNISNKKYLKLEVSDNGHGIEEEILGKIFDPYFTTKEIGKGTGLGLAVVDGIVKDHNGFIKSYSTIGSGSTFQVFLPTIEQENSLFTQKEKTPGCFLGTEQIMLVDDETDILYTLQSILEKLGYTVSTFKNGKSALQSFVKNPDQFDLIITDMTMPRMNGDELSVEVLKIRNNMPIILCTGYHENFTEDMAQKMGITKYILKPVSAQTLSVLIREILDEKRINLDR